MSTAIYISGRNRHLLNIYIILYIFMNEKSKLLDSVFLLWRLYIVVRIMFLNVHGGNIYVYIYRERNIPLFCRRKGVA